MRARSPAAPPSEESTRLSNEHLPDQAARLAPHRGPHRDFFLTGGGPREQEVGDVRRGDEQHAADRRGRTTSAVRNCALTNQW